MLQSLAIENFKAFGQRQEIPLAPITLIFGANSSGKSSLLQSLLLLKQTLDEVERPDTVLLPKGKLVDLGSFKELIFRHDTSNQLTLALGIGRSAGGEMRPPFDKGAQAWARRGFTMSFTFHAMPRRGVQVDKVTLLDVPGNQLLKLERQPSTPRALRVTEVSRAPGLY